MVLLSERQSLLLQLLSEVERPLTGQALSSLLGVSPRTLRYDITRVNRVTGRDVVVGGTQGYNLDRRAYQAFTSGGVPYTTEVGNEERALLHLLDNPVADVYDMMADCYMGESVLRSTLRRLKSQLEDRGVSLLVRGSQVCLVADELDLRRVLGRLVHRAMDASGGRSEQVAQYLPDVDLEGVERNVREALARHGIAMDDIRLENLVITTAICVQRAAHAPDRPAGQPGERDRARRAVDDIAAGIGPPGGRGSLAASDREDLAELVRASYEETSEARPGRDERLPGHDVRAILTAALDETVAYFNLGVQRDKLLESLENHLRRMLRRVGTMLYFRNSLQETLRSGSPFLYDVAVFLADKLSRRLGVRFTDDEIGLLAVYFGLYAEQREQDETAVAVVLVCPRYQTLRDWLIAGLVQRYDERLRIIDIVGTPMEADAIETDLVITTVKDAGFTRPNVRVSAVLSDLDFAALDAAIARVRHAKHRAGTASVMTRFLDRGLFFVGQEFRDSTETIMFLAKAMESRQIVPPEYVDSALLRETYSSTAFARRFAIPHSMDFMADETKVAVLIPASPIDWDGADVTLVLMLAINGRDYDDFVEFYESLVRVLYDPRLFSEIRDTTTFEEFRDLLGERLAAQ